MNNTISAARIYNNTGEAPKAELMAAAAIAKVTQKSGDASIDY